MIAFIFMFKLTISSVAVVDKSIQYYFMLVLTILISASAKSPVLTHNILFMIFKCMMSKIYLRISFEITGFTFLTPCDVSPFVSLSGFHLEH